MISIMADTSSLRDIKLIIGLGNPGEEYAHTFHNAGRLFIAWRAQSCGKEIGHFKTPTRKHFSYETCDGQTLAVPTTFMNESGIAVSEALAFFNAAPEELLVVHDDSDLNLGEHAYAFDRGSAGHHGIDSVVGALGTTAFWRLRIGIRPEIEGPRKKAGEFVLRQLSLAERERLQGVFGDVVANAKLIVNVTPSSPA